VADDARPTVSQARRGKVLPAYSPLQLEDVDGHGAARSQVHGRIKLISFESG
jgi:hypothetical protein